MLTTIAKRVFDFILFSSLYIASCAVIMVWQTYYLFLHTQPSWRLMGFVFFATVCSYNFHWYLTPFSVGYSQRLSWAHHHKGWHLVLYCVGILGTFIFFLMIREHWMALGFGAFITFLYSAPKLPWPAFRSLKNIAVGKTIFLAMVWTYVTATLPIFVENQPWKFEFGLYAINRFLLIYPICILFDYRDREDDKKEGIRSMITYFNEKGIDTLFRVSMILFFISTCYLKFFGYPIKELILVAIPGAIIAILYPYAKRNFSDYLYYFVLDGLMMLSGLLMLIFDI